MPSDGSRRANLKHGVLPRRRPPPIIRLHRIRVPVAGPREAEAGGPASKDISSGYTTATACLPQWNVVPSTHMRCRTVASLRARATLARFRPRRFATSRAQRFRLENRVTRPSTKWAASYRAMRTIPSPTRLVAPVTSVSPDSYFLGVNPKCAPTTLDGANRLGSSIADLNVIAT